MAKTAAIKIPDDIEFRVIGNSFGLLIAAAGLLGGDMVRHSNFDYWLVDIVPLFLVVWMVYRLYRNFLLSMTAYHDVPEPSQQLASGATPVKNEQVIAGQITAKPAISADKVVEEVAKRIEAQKAEALKRNKFTN